MKTQDQIQLINDTISKKKGYETHIGRALKIIWGVFNMAWVLLIVISAIKHQNPVHSILFLLGVILLITGLLIRFNPITFGGLVVITCSILLVYSPSVSPMLINGIAALLGLFFPGLALFYSKSNV